MVNSSKTKTHKRRNSIVAIMLVAALAITGALAFLTAKDSAENKFTVGNVDIELTEPSWVEADGENIVPGQVIAKDPTITNTGKNDAYVYMMVEIPKAYSTDIVFKNDSGKSTVETKSHYPLFSFDTNEGWTLINSQVGTEDDGYDYYLYGYDASLAPTESTTLFNEVVFANVTENFVNSITGKPIINLAIKVTGYAIQSDFYNKEAGESATAATAWKLFAKQNNWTWPQNPYEGISTLNFVNEDRVLVHSESAYAGTPVTMYFDSSLAKTGYTFDWTDEDTGSVGYSGMPMPEEDTDLVATYTATGYESQVTKGLAYNFEYDEINGLYAVLENDYNREEANYSQYNGKTVVIPATVNLTFKSAATVKQDDGTYVSYPDMAVIEDGYVVWEEDVEPLIKAGIERDTQVTVPVKKLGSASILTLNPQRIIIPDSVTIYDTNLCSYGIPKDDGGDVADQLAELTLPYGTTELPMQSFAYCCSLKSINLPNSIRIIDKNAFYKTAISSINLPNSLEKIEESAFGYCAELKSVTIPEGVEEIAKFAFSHCGELLSASLPESVKVVGDNAFGDCSKLRNVTIKPGDLILEESVFSGCEALTDVYCDGTIQDWCNIRFANAFSNPMIYATNLYMHPRAGEIGYSNYATQQLTIPEEVTNIGKFTFRHISTIVNVSVPAGCTVDSEAFPSTCTITYR